MAEKKNPYIKKGLGGKDVDPKKPGADFVTKMGDDAERKLIKEVDDKYELVGILPGRVIWNDHDIDFRKISAETAAQLVEAECPFIKEKSKSSTAAKTA